MEWRMKAGLISLGPAHPAPSLALIPSLDSKAKERKSTKERIKYLFMISILPSSPPPPPPSSSGRFLLSYLRPVASHRYITYKCLLHVFQRALAKLNRPLWLEPIGGDAPSILREPIKVFHFQFLFLSSFDWFLFFQTRNNRWLDAV